MSVLDRNDGFEWPGMVRILGPCTVHAGCVFLFFGHLFSLALLLAFLPLLFTLFFSLSGLCVFGTGSSILSPFSSLPLPVFHHC